MNLKSLHIWFELLRTVHVQINVGARKGEIACQGPFFRALSSRVTVEMCNRDSGRKLGGTTPYKDQASVEISPRDTSSSQAAPAAPTFLLSKGHSVTQSISYPWQVMLRLRNMLSSDPEAQLQAVRGAEDQPRSMVWGVARASAGV